MCTITITKHLDNNSKWPKVFLCYDFVNWVTNEEEHVFLKANLDLFTIGTITLKKLEILIAILANLEFGNDDFTFDLLYTPSKIPNRFNSYYN
jgi:hypothetical protein